MSATILVVDDRAGIRKLLQEVLQSAGYEVISAASGNEAITIVGQEKIDLVMLDMKMSGMDGLETLTKIKEEAPHIVVLIMTAYEELEVLQEAARQGAAACISKPFDIDELKELVAQKLRAASA